MTHPLFVHIQKFVPLTQEEFSDMLPYLVPIQLKKKQNLLEEGKSCTHNYFVSKGLLRMFFINEKGMEQTIQFAMENWWMTDYNAFSTKRPSGFHLQAVEPTEVWALSFDNQEKLLQAYPVMERYFRLVHQRAHAASQFRIKSLYYLSREELYHQFSNTHPAFVQRVPQYLLASFLGFTPEYLSGIRKRAASNNKDRPSIS